ncbi:EamA family transporter [Campylobacter sp. LR264d]|uniref:DMT family transporter n=1 Tax=Campylobacter sp. LR264d TaxID=2593544 RepID=UPI00123BF3AB|nr:SMR family transporter [Campylobacter sp. LR264d]KAA6233770.1 EamA family transporter [Campylobacter sp. LR264d]
MKLAFLLLFLAIVFESIGTAFLKLENMLFALTLTSIFISISYVLMCFSLKKIPVGVAYAMWELIGTIFVLCIAFFIFNEKLSNTQILGVILAIIGILMINYKVFKP